MECVTDWGVTSPQVFTLDGGQDTDPNAIDFAKGYNNAVWGQPVAAGHRRHDQQRRHDARRRPDRPRLEQRQGRHDLPAGVHGQPEDQRHGRGQRRPRQRRHHRRSRQPASRPRRSRPPDRTRPSQGMENVLQGYQCGSVYKPIYLEAQAAVALATYLRAGQTPPAGPRERHHHRPRRTPRRPQPAVLLTPIWVNPTNMEATVIKDKFVDSDGPVQRGRRRRLHGGRHQVAHRSDGADASTPARADRFAWPVDRRLSLARREYCRARA